MPEDVFLIFIRLVLLRMGIFPYHRPRQLRSQSAATDLAIGDEVGVFGDRSGLMMGRTVTAPIGMILRYV